MTIKVLGYGRVSTGRQEISPEVQEKQCREWFEQTNKSKWGGDAVFIGMLMDKAVSGKVPLFERPKGQHILTEIGKGDVLVASKLSRAFRSVRDMMNVRDALKATGIQLVLLDINIDTSNPIGTLVLNLLTCIAEFERELTSERIREALQHKKSQGHIYGQYCPPGWQRKPGSTKPGDLKPHPQMRVVGEYALRRFQEGASSDTITWECNAMARKNQEVMAATRVKNYFNERSIRQWAVYAALGWPKLDGEKIKAKYGEEVFTVGWLRSFVPSV